MTAPAPDQQQAQPAPVPGELAPEVLRELRRQLDQNARDDQAAAEHAKATRYVCSRCGAGESWRRGKGVWFHDDRGAICSACDLDRRSFQQPDGAVVGDDEHRARVIAELVGREAARWLWAPLLVERARSLLPWHCETPGARPGQRFGYVDVPALVANLQAKPPPPPKRHDRGRKVRCAGCGAKGAIWWAEQVAVSAPTASDGRVSTSIQGYFRITWTCSACRRQDVEHRAEQLPDPDVPVSAILGGGLP